ncbi:peptidoglycan-binding protein [Geitlerinema sp. PCC 9228]|uniref:peptidoglycan-binding domain-containing protein n=1 Tax=Geitlerinema sp. PCC 9228 TaxID=111611 RepID=UPI001479D672|nr:peptidoglycan-binding protein [Geitlerinema sp. PCC 9228]
MSCLLLGSWLGMPVAIVGNFATNEAIAQTNINRQRPVLQIGSEGKNVSQLQAALKLLGYYQGDVDGVYDQATADAVSQWQSESGVPADGIVGEATWNLLFPGQTANSQAVETASDPPNNPDSENNCNCPQPDNNNQENANTAVSLPILRRGMQGSAIEQLQERLRVLGYFRGQATGFFGSQTEAAVESLQAENQIAVDGVVGPTTWRVLLR